MNKLFNGAWAALVVGAALILAFMFFFVDVGATKKEVTLQDNFDQTVLIVTTNANEAGKGIGSGVVVNPWGVLTACHVVIQDECKQGDGPLTPYGNILITIKGQLFNGTVTKFDPYSDLAYVTLNKAGPNGVSGVDPVTLACGKQTVDRTTIYGIGHPLGMEKNIKAGLLSSDTPSLPGFIFAPKQPQMGMDADHAEILGSIIREQKYFNMFDIMLLPGNSGGGMFDNHGNLIGIVSHITKFPELLPMTGPNRQAINIPTGYTYATKPEQICAFMSEFMKDGEGKD